MSKSHQPKICFQHRCTLKSTISPIQRGTHIHTLSSQHTHLIQSCLADPHLCPGTFLLLSDCDLVSLHSISGSKQFSWESTRFFCPSCCGVCVSVSACVPLACVCVWVSVFKDILLPMFVFSDPLSDFANCCVFACLGLYICCVNYCFFSF